MKSQTLREVLDEHIPTPTPIIADGILNEGNKLIMYGKPKAMKSIGVKRLMLSLAEGQAWLGHQTPSSGVRVLYLQMEITKFETQYRLRGMVNGTGGVTLAEVRVWTNMAGIKIDTSAGYDELEQEIVDVAPQLVIIDPIYKVLSGDMLNAQHMAPLFDALDRLIVRHGIAVVLIHHARKGPSDPKERHVDAGAEDMMGSVLFSAWPDSVIRVKRNGGELVFITEMARNSRSGIEDVTTRVGAGLKLEPASQVRV